MKIEIKIDNGKYTASYNNYDDALYDLQQLKNIEDKELFQRQVARDILSVIEEVCFSRAYIKFRADNGSNGQRNYIINYIKKKYDIE